MLAFMKRPAFGLSDGFGNIGLYFSDVAAQFRAVIKNVKLTRRSTQALGGPLDQENKLSGRMGGGAVPGNRGSNCSFSTLVQ